MWAVPRGGLTAPPDDPIGTAHADTAESLNTAGQSSRTTNSAGSRETRCPTPSTATSPNGRYVRVETAGGARLRCHLLPRFGQPPWRDGERTQTILAPPEANNSANRRSARRQHQVRAPPLHAGEQAQRSCRRGPR